ncbi:calcium-activated chloride channel regulator 1-like isoform X2 [Stegodyphus dumicola]|uniref:calcium-activated chloride channel regulator 1-like isoform X2 n=1 Tax=Stegodyphus dumicola TaxID=202533 RepID=UPI0015ABAC66|nr:calcium-activated chloride channel regulator 1-like isoform X2 [Stegodyphus dumicola]
MMKAIFVLTLTLYFISIRSLAASSIQIDNNGYSNILIALPPNLEKTEDRSRMINNLKASWFCEVEHYIGVRHFPEAPSKHNLLCREEGTWFTVLRNPDFAKGRNAAKRHPSSPDVTFQYVRESLAPRVVVAIETTSQMNIQFRYSLTKNAFSRFVLYDLPYGSELTLYVFENDKPSLITSSVRLEDEGSRSRYLEGQPLPESPSQDSEPCSECLLEYILQSNAEGNNTSPSPHIVILVTTQEYLNASRYPALKQQLLESEIQLHAFLFPSVNEEYESYKIPLYKLLSETGGQLVAVQEDILGNLYRGFINAVRGYKTHDLILQEYLPTEDEEDLSVQFSVDAALSQSLQISFSGPHFETAPLEYDRTTISGSGIQNIFLKKQELVPAWIFHVPSPQPGIYTISTRRKRDAISPVLLTVTGKTNEAEDRLAVKVWTEILTETKIIPPPVLIFAEIKRGSYPVSGANVVAYVHHPRNQTISEFALIDDGLGDIDITRDDGIYTRYFTDFTAPGFYNVYVKFGGLNNSADLLKGQSAKCCGSFFPSRTRIDTGPLQREAGPATFQVEAVNETDVYPPARATDLRLVWSSDRIFTLSWTAVGDDYDSGVAAAYEVKLFPSRFLVSYQFSHSGLEVYSATIETTPLAVYGTALYHTATLSRKTQGGVYYFFVRALDDAGNAGPLSNAVPVLVENVNHSSSINCEDEDLPVAQKRDGSAFTSRPFFFLILLLVIFLLL